MERSDLGALLAQLQLTDSAFPGGRYTLSHGLEGYVQAGAAGPAELPGLLADLLRHSVGPGDATALVLAHRAVTAGAWDTLVEVDRRLHAIKLNRELRTAAVRTGRQVLETVLLVFGTPEVARLSALVEEKRTPGNHAVVVGAAHAALGVRADHAVISDLFTFAMSWVGAAVRLGRLDFRRAQVVLHGAGSEIRGAARTALASETPQDIHGSVPIADVMSAVHERASARLFTT